MKQLKFEKKIVKIKHIPFEDNNFEITFKNTAETIASTKGEKPTISKLILDDANRHDRSESGCAAAGKII